jgi:hypothetical protein
MMAEQDRVDPVYRYVDDKIQQLKNDLLFNEFGDFQDKLESIQGNVSERFEVVAGQLLQVRQSLAALRIVQSSNVLVIGLSDSPLSYAQAASEHVKVTSASAIERAKLSSNPEGVVDALFTDWKGYFDTRGGVDFIRLGF